MKRIAQSVYRFSHTKAFQRMCGVLCLILSYIAYGSKMLLPFLVLGVLGFVLLIADTIWD